MKLSRVFAILILILAAVYTFAGAPTVGFGTVDHLTAGSPTAVPIVLRAEKPGTVHLTATLSARDGLATATLPEQDVDVLPGGTVATYTVTPEDLANFDLGERVLLAVTATFAGDVKASASETLLVSTAAASLDASVTADVTSGPSPLTVHLSAAGIGGVPPYTYVWNLGDGVGRDGADQVHTFQNVPTTVYGPAVAVTDSTGAFVWRNIQITVFPSPLVLTASATISKGIITGTASASGGVPPYTFYWTYHNLNAGGAVVHYHKKPGAGKTLGVLVVDANNDISRANVAAQAGAVSGLSVSASASPATGSAPLTVTFSGAVRGGTPPYLASWSFGDGGGARRIGAAYTYSTPGTYRPTLTVTDGAGNSASATTAMVHVR